MTDTLHIGFLLFPRVTQLDLTGPAQVLSRVAARRRFPDAQSRRAEADRAGGTGGGGLSYPKETTRKAPTSEQRDVVKDIINSPVAKDLMRTATREILRGVFGVGRR